MASSSNQNDSVTEDMIDECSMPKATKLCRQHGITSSSTRLSDIKVLLKSRLICAGTDSEEAAALLATKKCDVVVQKDLFYICEQVLGFAKELQKTKGPAVDQINEEFRHICTDVELSMQKMKNSVPTILVLGETGSGKSSFINLLLGEAYFPTSILSSSHVVCEIRYAEKRRVELQKADSESVNVTLNDDCTDKFVEELKVHVQDLDDNLKAVYKLAQVYLPCDILKSGLMIVDSPGIGESTEMTQMLLNYILKADVFIYIIDSTNAGGMQDRVKKLVDLVYRQSLTEQKICRPDTALFICNKWDDIHVKERKSVLNDIRKKIKDQWPGCEDDQIICFSTMEAEFIQGEGRMAPKFRSILQGIVRLVDVGRQVLVLRGFSLLYRYIVSCMQRFDTHLSQMEMPMAQRLETYKAISSQLSKLESTVTELFRQQREELKSSQQSLATELGKFIGKEENRQRICRFADDEIPLKPDWKDVSLEVRHKVYNSLLSLIKDWIQREDSFNKLAKTIEESLASKCPDFWREIYHAKDAMAGKKRDDVANDEPEVEFLPNFLKKILGKLPLGAKIILGIGLSPALLIGTIVRAPVFGIQLLYKEITLKYLEKDFKAANGDKEKKRQVCQRYAEKIVDDIISKVSLNAIIAENLQSVSTYLSGQEQKMKSQIDHNVRYLEQLNKDKTQDEQVQRVVKDLKEKSASIKHQLDKVVALFKTGINT